MSDSTARKKKFAEKVQFPQIIGAFKEIEKMIEAGAEALEITKTDGVDI